MNHRPRRCTGFTRRRLRRRTCTRAFCEPDRLHIDPYIVLGSAIVGLLVGITGAGGGALMTPMLILLFGVRPTTAISSDLVAAVLMRPIGAAVHLRAGTVDLRLVRWLALGSVPAAFLGAFLLHELGNAASAQHHVQGALGGALLVGALAMALRFLLDRHGGHGRTARLGHVTPRPVPTVALGVLGGVIVGLTSVGSGSLMIVVLLFIYPTLAAGQLVGTDLTQAVPLTLAAAAGALVFGHVELGVTASLVIGSVPAVLIGALLSANVPDRFVRPAIAFAIFASGLKYAGLPTLALGWTLCAALFVMGALWLAAARPWRAERGSRAVAPEPPASRAQEVNGGPPLAPSREGRPPSPSL